MSISTSGCARRSFIIGIRLCPPARIRASGPYLASSVSACSTLVAFSYSTCAGTCTASSSACVRPRAAIGPECTKARVMRRPMRHTGHCHDAHAAQRVCAGGPARLGDGRGQRARRQRACGVAGADGAAAAPRRPADHPGPGGHDADAGRLAAARHRVADRRARRRGARRRPSRAGRTGAAARRRDLDVRRVRGRPADGGVHPALPGPVEVSTGVAVSGEQAVLVANRLADVAFGPLRQRRAVDAGRQRAHLQVPWSW